MIFPEIKALINVKPRKEASVFGKEIHSLLVFLGTLLCSVATCIILVGPELEAEVHSYSSQLRDLCSKSSSEMPKHRRFCSASTQVLL